MWTAGHRIINWIAEVCITTFGKCLCYFFVRYYPRIFLNSSPTEESWDGLCALDAVLEPFFGQLVICSLGTSFWLHYNFTWWVFDLYESLLDNNWRHSNESTHQILSYGLLFLTFYHFPYTADPLTCTTPTWPSATFTWTFVQSPLTIPYTHGTISPVPHRRPPIWPTDHIVIFSFLSLFSFTQPDMSCRGPADHKSSHCVIRTLPYVSPHMNLVLILLIVCI